ncbi:MAG: ABC transporter permease subunit [Anaerolineae bacterium]|nr:MAG: ABC transporter permease subunit [Anaerolineae bacterium]
MQKEPSHELKVWASRGCIHLFLLTFGLIMLFPFIYMILASLKNNQDFASNPRRLLPFTQLDTYFQDTQVPLYSFDVNGSKRDAVIASGDDDKVEFGYLTTRAALEAELKNDTHANARRRPQVYLALPIGWVTSDGTEVELDKTSGVEIILSRADTKVELTDRNNRTNEFTAYNLMMDGQVQSTTLTLYDITVPLFAYSGSRLKDEEWVLVNTGREETLLDKEGNDRGYSVFELRSGESVQELLMASNSTVTAFVDPGDIGFVVYTTPVETVKAAEKVEFQLKNYDTVLGRGEDQSLKLDRPLVNTILVTISVVLGQIVTSVFGGYAFSRIDFKGRDTLFLAYLGSIMIPFVVLIVPMYKLMVAIEWNDRIVSLIVPWIFSAYGTFLMRQFFVTFPKEIEEAALLDGCSRLRILWRIFVPLSTPVIATQAIFTFLYAWNSFIWPLVIISTNNKDNHVLTLSLITLSNIHADKPNLVLTGAAVMILPPILVFILAQKYFVEGITSSGLKG